MGKTQLDLSEFKPFLADKILNQEKYEENCTSCGELLIYSHRRSWVKALKRWNNDNKLLCRKCKSKEKWKDDNYRNKVEPKLAAIFNNPATKKKWKESQNKIDRSEKIKKKWKDDEYRNNIILKHHGNMSNEIKDKLIKQKRYVENCTSCNSIIKYSKRKYWVTALKKLNDTGKMLCKKCVSNKNWKNDDYKRLQSEKSSSNWKNEEYKKNVLCSLNNKESIDKISRSAIKSWKNWLYKNNIISKCVDRWKDPEYKEKMAEIRANQPKVSSLALTFYSILDDMGIKDYGRENNDKPDDPRCQVARYTFDCFIPRENDKDLLIDVNGNWVHSQRKQVIRDRQKASYITNNWSHKYEYKYIWEHDLSCKNKVIELVKYWMGITEIELIDFNFKDIEIKKSKADEHKLLLAKYHYLPNAGRGGIVYGAYLNDELISVCVFSSLVRQNIILPNNYSQKQVRELSRFCIHPRYQKKNFASWFISKCIKKLDRRYKLIISYADTTFNHDGTIYKAANFIQDRTVKPDYWYTKEDGWVMHKRTLYGQAVNMKMKEREFAEEFGYTKVWGKEKLRYIYER